MKPSIFRAVADRIATETNNEWTLVITDWLVGHISSAEIRFDGQTITAIHCYGKSADWLYSIFVMLVKACFNYELAFANQQYRRGRAA